MSGDGKTRSAAAGGDGIGIADLERLADEIINKVDFGAAHEFEAERIDQHPGLVALEPHIVVPGSIRHHGVFVLEARAAPA